MTIARNSALLAALTLTAGLLASGCAKTAEAPTVSSSAQQPSAGATDLKSLVPTPANTAINKGPDPLADNGIHFYYQVNGAPNEAMDAFKTALQGKGWDVSTIVSSASGSGGGGATYIGTHGEAYGVFDGGGFKDTTYIDVCTWPVKPANPNCTRGER